MHKKHHKLHRHKDVSHKRSSKSKNHHKKLKNEHPVVESVLEPIQEVSKEKVKVDKNACGDYVYPFLQPEDGRKKVSEHRRDKERKNDTAKKLDKEEIDIFARNYLQKLEEPTQEKLVKHHSLEKSKASLITKANNLFRKEKSFNDAIQKVSNDLVETNKRHNKERKRRHASRKTEKEQVEAINEKKEKRKHHENTSKKHHRGDKVEAIKYKEEKRKKAEKKSAKSSEKSPIDGNKICSRVQEVIYCQVEQVPYKLKNDKSSAEIKDLYQRIKREKNRHKEGERHSKDRTHSHGNRNRRHIVEKDKSYQSHHSPLPEKINIEEKTKHERSKSRSKRVHEELIQEKRPINDIRKDINFDKHHHHELTANTTKALKRKHQKDSPSNVDLGPYEKYFAFENRSNSEHCHRKYHKGDKEHRNSSRDKRRRRDQEEVYLCDLNDDRTPCKRHQEKCDDSRAPVHENKLKTEEEKIHQIVEGDLKNYFSKIQHMIDQKLDVILRINKSRYEETKNAKDDKRKRNISKTKDKKSDKEERSKTEDKSKKENKNKQENGKNVDITKEEIIEEVLKRLKKETGPKGRKECGERKSKANINKELGTKYECRDRCDKIHKDEGKHSKEGMSRASDKIRNKLSGRNMSEQNKYYENIIDKNISGNRNIVSTEIFSIKGQLHEDVKNTRESTRRSSSRKQHSEEVEVHTLERSPDIDEYKQRELSVNQNLGQSFPRNRQSPRGIRTSENICGTKNLISSEVISSSRRSSDKKHRSSEKKFLPKDSLVLYRNHRSPPPELIVPTADIGSFHRGEHLRSQGRPRSPHTHIIARREGDFSLHSIRKHYTSASTCRAYSEHNLASSLEFKVAQKRFEQVVLHRHDEKYLGSDNVPKERCLSDGRKRSSSPERCNKISKEVKSSREHHNHHPDCRNNQVPLAKHMACSQQENLVVSHPEDFIMAPREFRKLRHRPKNHTDHNCYKESMNHSPSRRYSRHDIMVSGINYQENIVLPPEMFRTPAERLNDTVEQLNVHEHFRSPERQHPIQEFRVQGIEPPILERSRKKSGRQERVRKLECKTIPIIGIPPQIKELPMANQPQTSSQPTESTSPVRDLVEKRKQSKRFKLYYKYSVMNNSKDDKNSCSSEAKSIVSDSYRVVSDPSEEERAMVGYSRDVMKANKRHMTLEVSQIVNIAPKKWNRAASPRGSHLNNIIEEPSSISINNDKYFIPIKGTNECYFRALTSSNSEYCFKINKKPANSNISILSKDTCDGKYRNFEDGRCRYCKQVVRSKSDFKIVANEQRKKIFKSKSDVYLGGSSGKKSIRSIFLEDTHPFVRSRKGGMSFKRTSECKNIVKKKNVVECTCKECQTLDIKVNGDFIAANKDKSDLAFADKQRQFKDIYKTIDDLEENIHSSRKSPPNTLDAAVSPKFISLNNISDKKSQFKEIYNTIDNLEDQMIHNSNRARVKTVDVGTGSQIKIQRIQRNSRSEPRKKTHEIAVGVSKEQVVTKVKTPIYRSLSRSKRLKSTGVSPIRVVEDQQNSTTQSPTRKSFTPKSPIRPCVTRPLTQKRVRNIQNDTPVKKTVPKTVEAKKESQFVGSLRPKLILVKEMKPKSTEKTLRDGKEQKNIKRDDVPAIKTLRSEEKSASIKRRENIVGNQSKDRKPVENTTKPSTQQNQIHRKKEVVPRAPCFIVNLSENAKHINTEPVNSTEDSSKASARKEVSKEKHDVLKKPSSRTLVDDLQSSCIHHYRPKDVIVQKSSRATSVGSTIKPVTVNTALFKYQPASQKKCITVEGSTSSSLGDDSVQNIRRSKSLVELKIQRSKVNKSKSEIISAKNTLVIRKSSGLETNGGSVISGNMEKFTNVPKLRCHSSQSNVHSLDQFIASKFTSRLFLTKDYKGGEISAYQRRKLYDQSIRQKMKRKFRISKLDVGPQIFEVRFLSMVNQENYERKEKEAKAKKYFDKSVIDLNLEKFKRESSFYKKHGFNSTVVKNVGATTREVTVDHSDEKLKAHKVDLILDYTDNSEHSLTNHNILNLTNEVQSVVDIVTQNDEQNTSQDEVEIIKNLDIKGEDKPITELYLNDEKGRINYNEDEPIINMNNKVKEKSFIELYFKDKKDSTNYAKDAALKNINSVIEDKSVRELYFKNEKVYHDNLLSFCNKLLEVNSSMKLQEEFKETQCACSKFSKNCQSCKNFVNFMDMLCCSLASYCDFKGESVDFKLWNDIKFKNVQNLDESGNNYSINKNDVEGDCLHVPVLSLGKQKYCNNVQEIYSCSRYNPSGDSNGSTNQSEKIFKNLVDCESFATTNKMECASLLTQPLSCPVLPTNTSSFEFLYEEASSSDNEVISREIVLANLTRPFDQTFNLSMSQYNVEAPYFRRNSYFSSGTGSSESGYASIKSKNYRDISLTNFFKKPNISALFTPPVAARKRSELSNFYEQKGQGDFKKSILYEKMAKSCQLYAKKVRESSEMKLENKVDEYQEFPLAVLLGKDSSVLLESKILSQHSSSHVVLISNKEEELNIEEIADSETNREIRGVLDAGDKNDVLSRHSEMSFIERGCKLVLSNESLKVNSITPLEADIFNEECTTLTRKVSKESQKEFAYNDNEKTQDSSFTLDFSLDSSNPFLPSKDMVTQKFLRSLLKMYEKEKEFCNKLFKDDEFLRNVLLVAVEERKNQEKRNKKRRFGRLFRKKVQDIPASSEENKYKQKTNSQIEALRKLQNLAFNAKKCFAMLAEAVKINENIDDEIKICGLLKLLQRIESGDFYMIQDDEDSNFEEDIKSQVKEAFIKIYEICEKEAKKVKRHIGDQEINLIKGFVSKYRVGLLSKTDIVACYIGSGIIQTEAQLKAAVTYLMRCQSNEINIKKLEEYCNFTKP